MWAIEGQIEQVVKKNKNLDIILTPEDGRRLLQYIMRAAQLDLQELEADREGLYEKIAEIENLLTMEPPADENG